MWTHSQYAASEVLSAVTTDSAIFRDMTPCGLVEVHRRFGNVCELKPQIWFHILKSTNVSLNYINRSVFERLSAAYTVGT
jgi:hypothetical protein